MVFKPKQSQNPYGYRNLLAYKKAEELQIETARVRNFFPRTKTISALADQMNRSARSTKQNIAEGWKRNSTKEYYEFLGFAVASNAELEEDCNDIWNGIYSELMGIKGIMGEKGLTGNYEKGITGEKSKESPSSLSPHLPHSTPLSHLDIEKIKFYPLDINLPMIVQLKLRAKELNFILARLQKSLEIKIAKESEDIKKKMVNHFRQQW